MDPGCLMGDLIDLIEHYCLPYDTALMCYFREPPHNVKGSD